MGWRTRAVAALCSAAFFAIFFTPQAQAVIPPVVRDGGTAATAAASCWEIKQKFPSKPTGAYWLVTPAMNAPEQFFCDQDYRGGGWVLLGRGREGWTWDYQGQGKSTELLTRTRQPNQFAPVQLSTPTIDGLLNGGRVDALPDGLMLRRSLDWAGQKLTDMNWSMQRDRWSWAFGAGFKLTWSTYDYGQQYSGGTTNDFGINQTGYRAVTDPMKKNKFIGGWAYGTGTYGSPDPNVYQWSPDGGSNAIPYAELYIRPQISSDSGFASIPDSGRAAVTNQSIAQSYALRGAWGVTNAIPGTTGEGNVPTQAFAQVGERMFVGGNFTTVQNGSTPTQTVQQTALAAFNASTGDFVPSFRPQFNNSVRTLVKLPNGMLLVGGDFTEVNGQPFAGLVALDPSTGEIAPGWTLQMQNRLSIGVVRIHDLEVAGNFAYISGQFTHLGSSANAMVYARNAARINLQTYAPDSTWNPEFTGTVYDGDVSEDGKVFWAAGWFDRSRNVPSYRGAAVSTGAGAPLVLDSTNKFVANTWSYPEHSPGYQQAVQQAGNRVYFGGAEHSLFGFDISTLNRVSGSITKPGGDFQTIAVSNGVVYAGCHCNGYSYQDSYHYIPLSEGWTQADKVSWLGAWDAATGRRLPAFNPPLLRSSDNGAWEIFVADDGTVWAGGDFTGARYNPTAAQWAGGFVRFAQTDTTPPPAPTNLVQYGSSDTAVTLAWQGSAGVTYEVLRDDRVIGVYEKTEVTVPRGGNDRFFVRAVDAAGNRSATTAVLVAQESTPVPAAWVKRGDTWAYYNGSAALPADWMAPTFDNSKWKQGAAPLGWGGDDIATNLDQPAASRPQAMYFRGSANISSLAGVSQVTLSAVADDGAVVYINGQELGRVRMPSTIPTSTDYATAGISYADAQAKPLVLDVPVSMLKVGVNSIAVETHLNYRSAPSSSFALTLADTTYKQVGTAPAVPTGLSQTSSGDEQVALKWNAVSGAVNYEVLRDGYVVAITNDPAATVSTGGTNTFTVRAVNADSRRSGASAPVTVAQPVELIDGAATWSYYYDTTAVATDWNKPAFNAATWQSGAAPLGWGGSDVATNLDRPTDQRALAMYFTRKVTIADASALGTVDISVVADDGAVVYVNGVEVGRARMPAGPVGPNTYASAAVGYGTAMAAPFTFEVPASLLVDGVNTVSVETHLNYKSASSASFKLSMTAEPA